MFEMCILELYGDYFVTSDLLFGFKKRTGCNDALYTVKYLLFSILLQAIRLLTYVP